MIQRTLSNNFLFSGAYKYRLENDIINDETLTAIQNMIKDHESNELPRLQRLQRYYLGDHDIRRRVFADDYKANNRLVHNFPNIITNQLTSFGFGVPIGYTSLSDNELFVNTIKTLNKGNNEFSHNLAIATTMSVFGSAYELLYLENGDLKFSELPVEQTFMIYDYSINPHPIFCVRYYAIDDWNNQSNTYVEIRSAESTNTYISASLSHQLTLQSSVPNLLGDLPVSRYLNNKEALGDWENSVEIIDGYNICQSDDVNNAEAFADAYLTIRGMGDSESEDFEDMKRKRVLLLDDEHAEAKWLVKQSDHHTAESLKTRLKQDIYNTAGALDMNEIANTSHISGSAIRYKLLQTESLIKKKEQYFKSAIYNRLRIITNYLNLRGATYDYKDIHLNFQRNLPIDYQSVGEFTSKINGVISKETLFEQLEFIENPTLELQRLRNEREEFAFRLDDYDDVVDTGDQ